VDVLLSLSSQTATEEESPSDHRAYGRLTPFEGALVVNSGHNHHIHAPVNRFATISSPTVPELSLERKQNEYTPPRS
jgi:hypothetical protein